MRKERMEKLIMRVNENNTPHSNHNPTPHGTRNSALFSYSRNVTYPNPSPAKHVDKKYDVQKMVSSLFQLLTLSCCFHHLDYSSISMSLSPSNTQTHTLTLSHTLSLFHTQTHTRSLTLSFSFFNLSLSISLPLFHTSKKK